MFSLRRLLLELVWAATLAVRHHHGVSSCTLRPCALALVSAARGRAFVFTIVAALLLMAGTARAVPPPMIDSEATPPAVREGTTLVQPVAEPPRKAAPAPSDAPRLEGPLPRVAPPPASFNTYDGGWIRFAYPPGVRERVQPLIAQADDVRAELKARLGQNVLDKVSVYVARTAGEMATLAPENAPFPKYAAGVAYSEIGLVLLTITPIAAGANHNLQEIFRHELAHVALHDAVAGRPVPRWFNEGFAVYASGESSFARMNTLFSATISDRLMGLKELDRTFPADAIKAELAYAQAADVLRFLLRQQDRHRFTGMVERVRKGQSFDGALQDAYGTDVANLEYEWREDVARRYTFWPVFFSGSMVWAVAFGLFFWGWRRKRRQSRETLDRWRHEEAAEDELKQRAAVAPAGERRVHIVLARSSQRPPPNRAGTDPDVPKVEHDGRWHTLH
jgi:hypothetical protein